MEKYFLTSKNIQTVFNYVSSKYDIRDETKYRELIKKIMKHVLVAKAEEYGNYKNISKQNMDKIIEDLIKLSTINALNLIKKHISSRNNSNNRLSETSVSQSMDRRKYTGNPNNNPNVVSQRPISSTQKNYRHPTDEMHYTDKNDALGFAKFNNYQDGSFISADGTPKPMSEFKNVEYDDGNKYNNVENTNVMVQKKMHERGYAQPSNIGNIGNIGNMGNMNATGGFNQMQMNPSMQSNNYNQQGYGGADAGYADPNYGLIQNSQYPQMQNYKTMAQNQNYQMTPQMQNQINYPSMSLLDNNMGNIQINNDLEQKFQERSMSYQTKNNGTATSQYPQSNMSNMQMPQMQYPQSGMPNMPSQYPPSGMPQMQYPQYGMPNMANMSNMQNNPNQNNKPFFFEQIKTDKTSKKKKSKSVDKIDKNEKNKVTSKNKEHDTSLKNKDAMHFEKNIVIYNPIIRIKNKYIDHEAYNMAIVAKNLTTLNIIKLTNMSNDMLKLKNEFNIDNMQNNTIKINNITNETNIIDKSIIKDEIVNSEDFDFLSRSKNQKKSNTTNKISNNVIYETKENSSEFSEIKDKTIIINKNQEINNCNFNSNNTNDITIDNTNIVDTINFSKYIINVQDFASSDFYNDFEYELNKEINIKQLVLFDYNIPKFRIKFNDKSFKYIYDNNVYIIHINGIYSYNTLINEINTNANDHFSINISDMSKTIIKSKNKIKIINNSESILNILGFYLDDYELDNNEIISEKNNFLHHENYVYLHIDNYLVGKIDLNNKINELSIEMDGSSKDTLNIELFKNEEKTKKYELFETPYSISIKIA